MPVFGVLVGDVELVLQGSDADTRFDNECDGGVLKGEEVLFGGEEVSGVCFFGAFE